MKYGVIDIGSNSVRLMMWSDGTTLYKQLDSTRLGEGIAFSGRLSPAAMERSAEAVKRFKTQAEREGANKVFAFATAAVRSAANGGEFVAMVKVLADIDAEVISGEEEAAIGLMGALGQKDGGIIDIGGGSTELTLKVGGMPVYSRSLDIGAVRLFDLCGRDKARLQTTIDQKILDYGEVNCTVPIYGIGGTVTSLAALSLGLKEYDPAKVQDHSLTKQEVACLADGLFSMTAEEIAATSCLPFRRAEIIAGGALLLSRLMNYLDLQSITVSERDNLEGYLERLFQRGRL
jgi:exopolyphosphatase/guanosine-5'-triphosphate,3'-diphosphate pyrophosphatase